MSRFYDIEITEQEARTRFAAGEHVYLKCSECGPLGLHAIGTFTDDGFVSVLEGVLPLNAKEGEPSITSFIRKELM
jgi:hypothetical protein